MSAAGNGWVVLEVEVFERGGFLEPGSMHAAGDGGGFAASDLVFAET